MAFSLRRNPNALGLVSIDVSYEDGIKHHVICEGARFHTPNWDSNGEHCSEKDCEVNHGGIREYIDCPPQITGGE